MKGLLINPFCRTISEVDLDPENLLSVLYCLISSGYIADYPHPDMVFHADRVGGMFYADVKGVPDEEPVFTWTPALVPLPIRGIAVYADVNKNLTRTADELLAYITWGNTTPPETDPFKVLFGNTVLASFPTFLLAKEYHAANSRYLQLTVVGPA